MKPGTRGSNIGQYELIPVALIAAIVTPWYPHCREITFVFSGAHRPIFSLMFSQVNIDPNLIFVEYTPSDRDRCEFRTLLRDGGCVDRRSKESSVSAAVESTNRSLKSSIANKLCRPTDGAAARCLVPKKVPKKVA